MFHDCLCTSSTEHITSVLDRTKSAPLVCMGHNAARSDHVVLVGLAKLCCLSCISVLVDVLYSSGVLACLQTCNSSRRPH